MSRTNKYTCEIEEEKLLRNSYLIRTPILHFYVWKAKDSIAYQLLCQCRLDLKVVWHICKHSRSPWNFLYKLILTLEEYGESF